jgi:hypothetical protein
MTQDEIIEMAREACLFYMDYIRVDSMKQLEDFAHLVAAKKQERIIEVVERLGTWAHITEVVAEIRGEA